MACWMRSWPRFGLLVRERSRVWGSRDRVCGRSSSGGGCRDSARGGERLEAPECVEDRLCPGPVGREVQCVAAGVAVR